MQTNSVPATPRSTKSYLKRPERREQCFTFEEVREALQTVRGYDRHRQGLGLRADRPMLRWEGLAPIAPEKDD